MSTWAKGLKKTINFVHYTILFIFLFSCSKNKKIETKNKSNEIVKEIDHIKYHIKDTVSKIVIRHDECTECLDAFFESGKLCARQIGQ